MSDDRFAEALIPSQSSSRPGWKKEILFLVGLAFFIVVVTLFAREQAEQG